MPFDANYRILKASTTQAGVVSDATAAEGAVEFKGIGPNGALFMLDVTAAATEANDTLNVTVEGSIDGGTNFFEVLSFAEVLGNGGAIQHYEPILQTGNVAGFIGSAALGAGTSVAVQALKYRVRWSIVDPTGTNASFTFSVGVMLQ